MNLLTASANVATFHMNADSPAAFGASPFHLLISDELPYAVRLNRRKVFNHAHAVFSAVSLIKMLELIAREFFAFKTIFPTSLFEGQAVLDFAVRNGYWFFGVESPATNALVLVPQKSLAQTAIHAARSDKGCLG